MGKPLSERRRIFLDACEEYGEVILKATCQDAVAGDKDARKILIKEFWPENLLTYYHNNPVLEGKNWDEKLEFAMAQMGEGKMAPEHADKVITTISKYLEITEIKNKVQELSDKLDSLGVK